MLKMLKKFFDFCNEKNRKKFYGAVALGVLDALFGSLRIPAAFFAITAVLNGEINAKTFITVIGFMLVSTIGKMVVNRFSHMKQTEGGYDTCAQKRIEIGEHLRYLPMGYFNDTSLGHITSVTTNTLEQMSDIATRAIMMVLQGSITTAVIAAGMFVFDYRIGLISLSCIAVFMVVNTITNRRISKVAGEKIEADKEMVGVILEYIQGIAEIRNYNIFARGASKVSSSVERKKNADIKAETTAIPAVGFQMLVCKMSGVVIAGASLLFYFNGSMELNYLITMLY